MVELILRDNGSAKENLSKFEAILVAYDLRVVKQEENKEQGTIVLTINSHTLAYVRSVVTAAFDCFTDNVKGFSIHP